MKMNEADRSDIAGERSLGRHALWHIALLFCSALMLYPLLWMVSSSFKPEMEIFQSLSLWPKAATFQNYTSGWVGFGVSFGRFFANSFVVAILSVIGNVATCAMTAFAFTFLEFKGRRICFALMLGTLMLPYHVTLIPQYVMFVQLGWINTFLPLVLPKFLATDAFFIFLMVQFFRGIPKELFEAALMDGCNKWRIFVKIILPLSVPVLATAAIFSFIWTWEDFFGPLVYLSDVQKYTAPLALRTFVDSTSQSAWGPLFAMSVLSLVPPFILFLLFQRLLIQGIATSGLKG